MARWRFLFLTQLLHGLKDLFLLGGVGLGIGGEISSLGRRSFSLNFRNCYCRSHQTYMQRTLGAGSRLRLSASQSNLATEFCWDCEFLTHMINFFAGLAILSGNVMYLQKSLFLSGDYCKIGYQLKTYFCKEASLVIKLMELVFFVPGRLNAVIIYSLIVMSLIKCGRW